MLYFEESCLAITITGGYEGFVLALQISMRSHMTEFSVYAASS